MSRLRQEIKSMRENGASFSRSWVANSTISRNFAAHAVAFVILDKKPPQSFLAHVRGDQLGIMPRARDLNRRSRRDRRRRLAAPADCRVGWRALGAAWPANTLLRPWRMPGTRRAPCRSGSCARTGRECVSLRASNASRSRKKLVTEMSRSCSSAPLSPGWVRRKFR